MLLPGCTAGNRISSRPVAGPLEIRRAKAPPNPVHPGQLKVRSEKRVDGYLLEAFIPADALTGFDPAEHPRLGFTYAVTDRELGEQYCPRQYSHADTDPQGTMDAAGEDELEEKTGDADEDEGIRDHRGAFVKGLGVLVDVPEELPSDELSDHHRSQHQKRDQRQQPGPAQCAQPAPRFVVSETAARSPHDR